MTGRLTAQVKLNGQVKCQVNPGSCAVATCCLQRLSLTVMKCENGCVVCNDAQWASTHALCPLPT